MENRFTLYLGKKPKHVEVIRQSLLIQQFLDVILFKMDKINKHPGVASSLELLIQEIIM